MSKGIKIVFGIVITLVLIVGGLLFWNDMDFSISEDNGTITIGDEEKEMTFREEDHEGEIKSDVRGIPLPQIKLSELLMFTTQGDSFHVTYAIMEDIDREELKDSYSEMLIDDGWWLEEEMTYEEGDQLTISFYRDEVFRLVVDFFHDELQLNYSAPRN